jgi:protein phosphatase PTC1
LWDVCSDQDAVDLVRNVQDPVAASKLLVDHALARFSTDNLSCMIVRFDKDALVESQKAKVGVEGDTGGVASKLSEAEKIVSSTKQKIADGEVSGVGVSASNSGRGYDPSEGQPGAPAGESMNFTPTVIQGSVEEEPGTMSDESPVTAENEKSVEAKDAAKDKS